jgi:Putative prokaryotic signal transducing protein
LAGMVQVKVAGDLAEAEEIQAILNSAGIPSELQPAVEQHPAALDDSPQKVLVPEDSLEEAQHAIEAMTDPDELIGGR